MTALCKSLSVALDDHDEIEHFYSTKDLQALDKLIDDKNIDII